MKHRILFLTGSVVLTWYASALAVTTNLLDLTQWQTYGTVGLQSGTLTVGDAVGYDENDSDQDGNPYYVWFEGGANLGVTGDYDEAVTVNEFTAPLTLTWTGCLPVTEYGYNNIVLGKANPAFTGIRGSQQYLIQQELGFTSRWDYGSTLNTFVNNSGNYAICPVSGASAAGSTFCGEYKIVWENDVAKFYYNGAKVNEQHYPYTGPVKLVIRSFERAHTLTSLTIETGSAQTTPTLDQQWMGAMVGNFQGTATDANGNSIQIDPNDASVAVDVRVITNAAGNIAAHVSGAGATRDGSGISFRFEADYDTVTQDLSGTYTDNINTTPRPIHLTMLSPLNWQAQVTGNAISSNGTSYDFNVTLDIILPDQALFPGGTFPADRRFTGSLNRTQAITVPVSVLGITQNFSTNIVVEGSWQATAVPVGPGVIITGTYSGAFRMDPVINFTTSVTIPSPYPGITLDPVPVSITIDPVGRFDGTLSGDLASNTLRFSGGWSTVSSDGMQAGGTMDMTIPLDQQGGLPDMTTTSFSGSITRPVTVSSTPQGTTGIPTTVSMPLTVDASVPFIIQ
ncbi:MAG: hypothetical protein OEV89_00355 [Desulfobulbaceae bacterium]|nr:hypothetical protein [Desulfobulbaceae bacterium]HIJ89293.1 hypothetical protein [Deltaproteobacteria bacterium]